MGGKRAVERCDLLGLPPFSDTTGGLFRPWLGNGYRETVNRASQWMRDAGMVVRVDEVGNLIGRYEGKTPDAPALLIGSHLDSVRNAGRYDGMLGVMLGIETVAHFHEQAKRFDFAIEVIGFGDEEGSRFPVTMISTRAVAGVLGETSPAMVDFDGVTLSDALSGFGLKFDSIRDARRERRDVLAYIEAHIEQGPVLEAEDRALGVVSGIAAQYRFLLRFTGRAGHAGTMAMSLRSDALVAAAQAIIAIETIARSGPDGLVATVGKMDVGPGATNVVPGLVEMSLDLRAGAVADRDRALADIRKAVTDIAHQRGVGVEFEEQQDLDASPCDPALVALMNKAVARVTNQPARLLVSGAGHDAMVMARLLPTAMLFIRCEGGVSHNPAEAVQVPDVELALSAMVEFVSGYEETL